jgi:hypothetical protein
LSVASALLALAATACTSPSKPAAPPDAAVAPHAADRPEEWLPEAQPHHELHLPPVGPAVHVAFDGRSVPVVLADLPRDGGASSLMQLWTVAFPAEDAALLHFALLGSDGFRPASRPKCARLLTSDEIASARIDAVTHDVSFADGVELPGCYRVKALVGIEGVR